jgi:hypothetical protein
VNSSLTTAIAVGGSALGLSGVVVFWMTSQSQLPPLNGFVSEFLIVPAAAFAAAALALLDTYAAVPAPKLVIAVGACAISGGPCVDNPEVHNGCGSCCLWIFLSPAARRIL